MNKYFIDLLIYIFIYVPISVGAVNLLFLIVVLDDKSLIGFINYFIVKSARFKKYNEKIKSLEDGYIKIDNGSIHKISNRYASSIIYSCVNGFPKGVSIAEALEVRKFILEWKIEHKRSKTIKEDNLNSEIRDAIKTLIEK